MRSAESIEKYYRNQSKFYDITRPFFLFGRNNLAEEVSGIKEFKKILEVGCGTGNILSKIEKKTKHNLTGIDLSPEMLSKAEKNTENVRLINTSLEDFQTDEKFDIIIASYFFTINFDGFLEQIKECKSMLTNDGEIFVVDFHSYGNVLYKSYMNYHGIEMGEELYNKLKSDFSCVDSEIKNAYLGLWKYFYFRGKNKQ